MLGLVSVYRGPPPGSHLNMLGVSAVHAACVARRTVCAVLRHVYMTWLQGRRTEQVEVVGEVEVGLRVEALREDGGAVVRDGGLHLAREEAEVLVLLADDLDSERGRRVTWLQGA
jgi:hypothetical protein